MGEKGIFMKAVILAGGLGIRISEVAHLKPIIVGGCGDTSCG